MSGLGIKCIFGSLFLYKHCGLYMVLECYLD